MKNNVSRKCCLVDKVGFHRFRYLAAQLAICLVAATVVAEPVRLAVIAEGNSESCRNLADLLQVELSKREDLELVDREEIDSQTMDFAKTLVNVE